MKFIFFCKLFTFALTTRALPADDLSVYDLRTGYQVNPLGVDLSPFHLVRN